MRRPVPSRAVAALAVLGLAATGCSVFRHTPEPSPAAQSFLDAWGRGDLAAAAGSTDDAAGSRAGLQAMATALAAARAELRLGAVTKDGDDRATAAFTAAWTLPGVAAPWRYDGRLPLVRGKDAWTVHWEPADLHPRLAAGQQVAVRRALPERAALADGAGAALFIRASVVTIGVEPDKAPDLPRLAAALAAALGVSAADIVRDVRAAKPAAFVPVVTLRRPDYDMVRAKVHDLPGTVFQQSTRLVGPTARFAQPMLGRVGEATAEVVKASGGRIAAGDPVGVSGLQRALNDKLAGQAGATVLAVDGGWRTVGTLGQVAAVPGTTVRTTLDRRVQTAADAAVATQATPAAVVAVRPSTGAILAVSDNGKATFDIALAGRYPAGSDFKIITATALLDAKVVTESGTVPCPGTITVHGKTFHNEDSFDLARVPFGTAFAHSCNTSFAALVGRLGNDALTSAAARYGVGSTWTLPVPSFGGSVPAPKDDTEKAADAIGQGRVEVSPLAMALVAAAVRKGSAVLPSLLAGTVATPTAGVPAGPPAAVLPALRDMMRAVVTDGTARALADLPGAPVAGKTGTAEYGTAVPPRSHAWFVGYRGDLAFAVFVQDGQSSGTTAVPVARTFLAALG